jgi:lipid II:glycine glycyltransferase (peptidoglycan interpeptide bridge formation enzyme)
VTPGLQVRPISDEQHLAYVASRPSVSFLQTPAWGRVKQDWRAESIGWMDASGSLLGAGLVLYRQVPRLRRYLAYLPEGPDLPWEQAAASGTLADWLDPLQRYLTAHRAFAVRLGPPVVTRTWDAPALKAALASGQAAMLADLAPTQQRADGQAVADALARAGWQPPAVGGEGFATGQPQYVFWLPLAGRTLEEVFAGFNQLWRRNVRKADKSGVLVQRGTRDDLAAFHTLYRETAERDHFTPRPLAYFTGMWDAMTGEHPDRLRLYLAHHEGDLVAATTMVQVGEHAWYSYGASSTAKREVRGSNAVQWRMISDAHAAGAGVYDLRGITATVDPHDPHVGLIQFKLGTGGHAVEYVGEWTLPLNRVLHRAFEMYLARRS